MVTFGSGPPLVLVPGIQGRWEWMRPAVDALAKRCRVITFSLCGDPGSGMRFDPPQGVDNFVRQIDAVLDRAGLERAALCGVSLGGIIATRYAARRPERVAALVLVSAPGPGWTPDRLQRFYARAGTVAAPLFAATSLWRLSPEIVEARGGLARGAGWLGRHIIRVLLAPASPGRMRQRIRLWLDEDRLADCRQVSAPTLVVTGEPRLDRIVPVAGTREFCDAIPGAAWTVIGSTGHIGLVTRPERFADAVAEFIGASRWEVRGHSNL
jgi:pimeloyl-ACP methyl ester carboxylesterase